MTDTFIKFNNIRFTYPTFENEFDADGKPIIHNPVFDNLTTSLPGKFTCLVGPNGSGKSTFMLLAAGRIIPDSGTIQLFGKNLATMDEEQRNLTASFVYQNMEFESTDKTGDLLNTVFENGGWKNEGGARDKCAEHSKKNTATKVEIPNSNFVHECIEVFELTTILDRSLNKLSKGEMQRTLLAFSLLYGCKSVFLDEPLFALEEYQKEKALAYLSNYSKKYNIPLFVSMHEINLTKKYAENVLLFMPNREIRFGKTEEILTKENIEKAYGIPLAMMKDSEDALNKNRLEESAAISDFNERTR